MHKLFQWFKERIGDKVIASHEIHGTGAVHIADADHASYLHKTQAASGFAYSDYDEESHSESVTPILTGILIGEMLSSGNDSGSTHDDDDDTNPSTPPTDDVPEFGGGQTAGGGAGGSWSDDNDKEEAQDDGSNDDSSDNSSDD